MSSFNIWGYICHQAVFGIIVLETQHRINSLLVVDRLRVFGNKTHSISPNYVSFGNPSIPIFDQFEPDFSDFKYWGQYLETQPRNKIKVWDYSGFRVLNFKSSVFEMRRLVKS